MRLTKNNKGKKVAEFSVTEFCQYYKPEKFPLGCKRQNILQLIKYKRLPYGVTCYKLGANYIIQSAREQDINLFTKK